MSKRKNKRFTLRLNTYYLTRGGRVVYLAGVCNEAYSPDDLPHYIGFPTSEAVSLVFSSRGHCLDGDLSNSIVKEIGR